MEPESVRDAYLVDDPDDAA